MDESHLLFRLCSLQQTGPSLSEFQNYLDQFNAIVREVEDRSEVCQKSNPRWEAIKTSRFLQGLCRSNGGVQEYLLERGEAENCQQLQQYCRQYLRWLHEVPQVSHTFARKMPAVWSLLDADAVDLLEDWCRTFVTRFQWRAKSISGRECSVCHLLLFVTPRKRLVLTKEVYVDNGVVYGVVPMRSRKREIQRYWEIENGTQGACGLQVDCVYLGWYCYTAKKFAVEVYAAGASGLTFEERYYKQEKLNKCVIGPDMGLTTPEEVLTNLVWCCQR